MPDSLALWFALAALLLCFALIVVLWAYAQNLKAKLMQSVGLIDELHKLSSSQSASIDLLKTQVIEVNKLSKSVRKEYGAMAEQVDTRISKVEDTVERLEEQDPALKMYSRASKLVEQGAAMDDIIEASGLPRAEVEVLISLHARK
ncbi:DUF2802 domain-containing protein [Glaciecola sp. SC05]|uniref:DUF2802 domain-containing protein n=1 Tax=Glaciecola sp. SC05 TaxID=1987355 RepID=UPI003527D7EB